MYSEKHLHFIWVAAQSHEVIKQTAQPLLSEAPVLAISSEGLQSSQSQAASARERAGLFENVAERLGF